VTLLSPSEAEAANPSTYCLGLIDGPYRDYIPLLRNDVKIVATIACSSPVRADGLASLYKRVGISYSLRSQNDPGLTNPLFTYTYSTKSACTTGQWKGILSTTLYDASTWDAAAIGNNAVAQISC
jgi:hypothetical protein